MSNYKLDMFKEVLPNLDRRNLNFFSTLDEDQQKGFAAVVAMRFMSSTSSNPDWHLIATNQRANVYLYEMQKHPELQWKLLASNGLGSKIQHSWIGNAKKLNTTILQDFVLRYWPHVNRIETDIILNQFDKRTFSDFVDGTGIDADDSKKIKKAFEHRQAQV